MTGPAYLEALEREAEAASAAETGYRREAAERIRTLARERTFAFRRLNLMRSIAQTIAGADSEEAAVASARSALCARLGWAADGEAHAAILARFAPVTQALFALQHCDGDAAAPDVAAALAEFESWYAGAHRTAFWDLFEQYVVETPLVDF